MTVTSSQNVVASESGCEIPLRECVFFSGPVSGDGAVDGTMLEVVAARYRNAKWAKGNSEFLVEKKARDGDD